MIELVMMMINDEYDDEDNTSTLSSCSFVDHHYHLSLNIYVNTSIICIFIY